MQILLQDKAQKLFETSNSAGSPSFFLPHLTKNYYINFYGGEPLLSFDLIEETISFLKYKDKELKKRAHYTITTNGTLLTGEIIQFLSEHKFSVELSFDGLAQDVMRKKGSYQKVVSNIRELLNYPKISLEVNSVFTPVTVGYISKSTKSIVDLGVPNIRVSFSTIKPWNQEALLKLENEMAKLRKIVAEHYEKEGNIPVENFKDIQRKRIYYCAAGKDRLALSADGEIWGCYLFPDYFKGIGKAKEEGRGKEKSKKISDYEKFCFGSLKNFIKNHWTIYPRILQNYRELSMDNFTTPKMECFLCEKLESCGVCPVNAAFSRGSFGRNSRLYVPNPENKNQRAGKV